MNSPEEIDGVIIAVQTRGNTGALLAHLDTGERVVFTKRMAQRFCPREGTRVMKTRPFPISTKDLGVHYVVSTRWRCENT